MQRWMMITIAMVSLAITACEPAVRVSQTGAGPQTATVEHHPDVVTLTEENFAEVALQSDKLVIVDFWAGWCGPCLELVPTINDLADTYGKQVVIGKVNVDDQPALAVEYQASSIPLVVFLKDGKVVERLVGLQPQPNYESVIDANLQ